MPKSVGILDWRQSAHERPRQFVRKDTAQLLVSRLAAEELIPGKLIRRFSPDSVFSALWPAPQASAFIPETLPPIEVHGHRFSDPDKSAEKRCYRFRMLLHARAIARGLLRAKPPEPSVGTFPGDAVQF